MLKHHTNVLCAECSYCLHVLELPHDKNLAANKPRHPRPSHNSDRCEHHSHRWLKGRNHCDEKKQCRKCECHIRQSHHQLIDPAAVVSGEKSKRDAKQKRNSLRYQSNCQ